MQSQLPACLRFEQTARRRTQRSVRALTLTRTTQCTTRQKTNAKVNFVLRVAIIKVARKSNKLTSYEQHELL
jgi:hypothetical protein